MEQELTTSLKKVVKGTGIVFVGTVLGTFLGFVFRVIVVRYIINGSIFHLTFTPWNNKASKNRKCRVFNGPKIWASFLVLRSNKYFGSFFFRLCEYDPKIY